MDAVKASTKASVDSVKRPPQGFDAASFSVMWITAKLILARLFPGQLRPRCPAGKSGLRSINQSVVALPSSPVQLPVRRPDLQAL
jgi:hypothetical protein